VYALAAEPPSPRSTELYALALGGDHQATGAPARVHGLTASMRSLSAGGDRFAFTRVSATDDVVLGHLAADGTLSGPLRPFADNPINASAYGWLTDGRVLVGPRRNDTDGTLYVGVPGRGVTKLVTGLAVDETPMVAAGDEVLFWRPSRGDGGGGCELRTVSPGDGGSEEHLVATVPAPSCDLSVHCPRGDRRRCILRTIDHPGARDGMFVAFDTTTGQLGRVVRQGVDLYPTWDLSPDGSTIVTASGNKVAFVAVEDGSVREIQARGQLNAVVFAEGGRKVLASGLELPDFGIISLDREGHVQTLLADGRAWLVAPAVAPDGRTFAMHRRLYSEELFVLEPQR
jgi:hypothetical protein